MFKLRKGSALVYTLIMMMLLLVSALGLATTTLVQQRRTLGTTESVRAFQLANDGLAEIINFNKNSGVAPGVWAKSIDDLKGTSGGTCLDGRVTRPITTANYTGTYDATFKDKNGDRITSCGTPISAIEEIKIVATVGSATRAIETAFAASGAYQLSCVPIPWEDDANIEHTIACCRLDTASSITKCLYLDTNGNWQTGIPSFDFNS